MTTVLLILSFLGFLTIVAEDFTKVDKAKTTLFFGTLVWVLYFIAPPDGLEAPQLMHALNENLLEIATLWLFLMAAMTFVAYVSHKGVIDGIVNRVMPTHMSERRLMLVTGLFAFFFSSMADNITATLVCITVLVSLNLSTEKLLRYIVLVVFAVNSGGAALITGDVTTLMIFLAGHVSMSQLLTLLVPASTGVIILAVLLSLNLSGRITLEPVKGSFQTADIIIAAVFFGTIVSTMLLNVLYGVPPVLTFLTGLSVMFLVGINTRSEKEELKILEYIRQIEYETLLFFLGVLLLVGMLKEIGVLTTLTSIYAQLSPAVANYSAGIFSSLLDNVPLTAALLKANPELTLSEWLGLTYAVGVGGSLLAIGSAAGILAMSKVQGLTFMAYLRFLPALLVAYSAGYLVTIWLSQQLFG